MKGNMGAVYIYRRTVHKTDFRTELRNNGEEHIGVTDVGHILNAANPIHQKSCRDHGNGCIFGPADHNFSFQRPATVNHISISFQTKHLPSLSVNIKIMLNKSVNIM